jgi:integrase
MQLATQHAPLAGAGATSSAPGSEPPSKTLAALIDAYMAAYAGRDRTRSAHLAWWLDELGAERPFASIDDDDAHAGLERLWDEPPRVYVGEDADGAKIYRAKKGGRANATINRYHAALMALFTWAIKRRHAPRGWENPARTIERRPGGNGIVRFLSDAERTRLLEACRNSSWPRLYCLVLLAITTGARRSELLALTWGHIDFERAIAHVHESKNDHPRALPLLPVVLAELARFKSDRLEARVFPSRSRITAPRAFESSWLTALKSACIKRFRFHDLRHTCASYLAQNGASLLEIADVLGQRQLVMVKRYAHLTTATKANLVNRVLGDIK